MEWKLSEFKTSKTPDINTGDVVNIHVLENAYNPVKYYGTKQFEVFNQASIKG
jgi:hypothetical protein